MNKNFLVLDFTRLSKNIVFKFKDKFFINKIETDSNHNREIIDDILNLIKGANIKTKENILVLEKSEKKFCYHFAFLINTGSLESSMEYLKTKSKTFE